MKNQTTKNTNLLAFENEQKKRKVEALLFGPENAIALKQSDPFLERLYLEMELRDGQSKIGDVVMTVPRQYQAIFHKTWFHRLADMFGVDRKVMDPYVKPEFVRSFFIMFVYARLSYKVFRELKIARKFAKANNAKLFQFLKDEYYDLIQVIAGEIYDEMEGKTFSQFQESYSTKHRLAIQQSLFL